MTYHEIDKLFIYLKNNIILLYIIKIDILVLTLFYMSLMTNTTVFYKNYFNEIPNDLKNLIFKFTIPIPPLPPPPIQIYEIDLNRIRFMDYLVKYYYTSIVMKKKYNNIKDIFYKYINKYVMNYKNIPYSKCYEINKKVRDFCQDHSTIEYRKNYKIERQKWY
tara:strand:- start:139 stop:627 length:489 start_codon:yes stop_codon:yes gene_type:complete